MSEHERTVPAPVPLYDAGSKLPVSIGANGHADRDLVDGELRHRFRNIVAVTQSLVNQTLRDEVTVSAARDSLDHRLAAMAGGIDLLLRRDWRPGSLAATVHEVLAYPVDFRVRIRCEGPEVFVGSDAVITLTLALHELLTNAIKYGALSVPEGSVELFWKILDGLDGQRLWIQWAERDGPPAKAPAKAGFGTRLTSDACRRGLGGEVEIEYTPGGLTWLLLAPLDRLAS